MRLGKGCARLGEVKLDLESGEMEGRPDKGQQCGDFMTGVMIGVKRGEGGEEGCIYTRERC